MRHILLATTAFVAVGISAPVFAQTAPAVDDGGIPDIVVTAQKRTERLQDIPVAASVLSSEMVRQQHVTDLSDINRAVPSVQIKGTFNGRVPYGMRGISTNANEGAIGLTSGVNIEIDGIPVPADSFAANTLSDIAQLEVLKGPQSTLGGRTASAGTINFVTNGPSKTAKGTFNFLMTEDGEYRVDAAVSGPITSGVSFSLAGFASKTPYPVYNVVQNNQAEAINKSIRGKLKFDVGEDFDLTLTGHYALATSHGDTFTAQYFTPGGALFPFLPFSPGGISQAVGYPYAIRYGNTTIGSPVDMRSRYEDVDGSVILNYRLGETTLTSTTSYFKENQFQSQDIFLSNVYFWNVQFAVLPPFARAPDFDNLQSAKGFVKQFTQEFKVATDPTKPLSVLAGAFYSDMTVNQAGSRVWVANPIAKTNISTTKNYALYARVTAKASDQFTIIGGLRYNKDKIGWNVTQFFNPPAGQFYSCNPNFDATGAVNGGPPLGCQWVLNDSSDALVGDVALQYHVNKDTMVYASYTRGYKPRAFNTVHDFLSFQGTGAILFPFLTPAQVAVATNNAVADLSFAKPAKKETIDSFELGFKASLMDRHMTLNAAAFYTNYKDYQAQIFDTSAIIAPLILANAGASTKGVEADLGWHSGSTSFNLAAAYIDSKFKNFKGATCYPTQTLAQGCVAGAQDLTGKPLPDSPKFKLTANISQTISMNGFNLILGSNVAYRSSTLLQANQNPQTNQPGFALLDASIGFQSPDEKIMLTFFANNITDHFYLTDAEDFFSGATAVVNAAGAIVGPSNFVVGQPARDSHRYFGGRLSVKF
jgi:iron complex outermembrane recepter protein